jgi:GNAT superfamily N-acetyltransferase
MGHEITQTRPGDRHWAHIERHSRQTVGYIADPNDTGDYRCFVATDERNAFMGLCIIALNPLGFGPLAEQTVACLENMLVDKDHRGQGIGSALLRTALAAAWEQGAAHVWWTVEYENTGAIAFYLANGAAFIPQEDAGTDGPERYYTCVIANPTARREP